LDIMMDTPWTPVAVMGAGALGCYFGAVLARAGIPVTLIGRPAHVAAIRRDGLRFESRGVEQRIPIDASEDAAGVAGARLVLFCVKSSDTDAAARAIAPHLASDAVVLSLQNGVNNVERVRAQIKNDVFPALVYAAAQMTGPGAVRYTGGGRLIVGRLKAFARPDGTDARLLADIAAFLVAAGIPVTISEHVEAELWTKLVMNCAYNAISALTGSPYGKMVEVPEIRAVMSEAVHEVVAVAAAKGIALPATIVDAAIKLADGMPTTISSTAQDMRLGKRTEIDHLNGYVVREGETLGIATPVNRTLDALVKLMERGKAVS
jgi:2-dehydropantoate 2-reductase